jgi:hypothetical protein
MDLKGYGFKNLDSRALITGFDIVQVMHTVDLTVILKPGLLHSSDNPMA